MAEISGGSVRVWHGKWQGMVNVRESPDDTWKRKTKNLTCYHEPDPRRPGQTIEVPLPDPKGRVTKAMTREAEKALDEWRADLIENNGRIARKRSTVAEYVEGYIDTLETNQLVEKSTVVVYRSMLKVIKGSCIGMIALDDLLAEDAEQFINEMVADGRAISSVRKTYNVLHGAIKHAVTTRRLPYDPISGVRTPKLPAKDPNSLDQESLATLVNYLDIAGVNANNTGFALALYTGMREGEVCGLRWQDVDLEDCVIHIRQTIARKESGFYIKEPKTRNSKRDIPFSEDLQAILMKRFNQVLKECAQAGIAFSGTMYVIGEIGDGTGTYKHPTLLWREWKAVAKSLNLKGMQGKVPTFHDLRHTYATVAAHLPGTDLTSVQRNLGHASIRTTIDIYANDNTESRRLVANDTAAAMRRAKGGARVLKLHTTDAVAQAV